MQVVKKEQIQFLDILLDLLYLHVFGSNLIPVEQSILFLHLHSQRSGSQKRSQGRLLHSASYNIHTKVAVTIEEDQVRYFDILVYFHKIKNKKGIGEKKNLDVYLIFVCALTSAEVRHIILSIIAMLQKIIKGCKNLCTYVENMISVQNTYT